MESAQMLAPSGKPLVEQRNGEWFLGSGRLGDFSPPQVNMTTSVKWHMKIGVGYLFPLVPCWFHKPNGYDPTPQASEHPTSTGQPFSNSSVSATGYYTSFLDDRGILHIVTEFLDSVKLFKLISESKKNPQEAEDVRCLGFRKCGGCFLRKEHLGSQWERT
jgi:hypothetical protein